MAKRFFLTALCSAFAIGCTHTLSIDNLPAPRIVDTAPARPLTIGVLSYGGSTETEYYVAAIADALALASSVEKVIYPYAKTADVDVVAEVSVEPEYRGAWTNFLVNWPGFLVFAPAWNGYKYRANPRTRVQLITPTGEKIETISWEHEYVFHQADMGRTWTQLGWLEYGVIPLVGGVVFTQYDTDQTPAFMRTVRDNFGVQVAAEISQHLAGVQRTHISQQ